MRKFTKTLVGAVLVAVIAPLTQTANAFTAFGPSQPAGFQTQADWIAALYGTHYYLGPETFDPPATVGNLVDGAAITPGNPTAPFGQISDIGGGQYVYTDQVTPGSPTIFTFTRPMYAFGGDFDFSYPNGQFGTGLQVWVDYVGDGLGNPVNTGILFSDGTAGFHFFGIVGSPDILTERFISLELRAVPNTEGEKYQVDNLVYAPVPLPAAAWLMLSGLAGFVALGRRRGESDLPA